MELEKTYKEFQITDSEYLLLDSNFGDLVHYAAWQLLKKNVKNNHTDELEDIAQDLRMSVVRAGIYHKRQVYIKNSFEKLKKYCCFSKWDAIDLYSLVKLIYLWVERKRHGANRRKFGIRQEEMLLDLVNKYVPLSERPSKKEPLKIDPTFVTYCKAITWNCQKSMGKKITKEKKWRSGLVSLSEFDYLCSNLN